MKKIIFLSITISSMVACNSKSNTTENNSQMDSTTTETPAPVAVDTTKAEAPVAELYACPMHPEVQGKKGDECPKCGMALTEPVKQ
jgi:hypothetical protein